MRSIENSPMAVPTADVASGRRVGARARGRATRLMPCEPMASENKRWYRQRIEASRPLRRRDGVRPRRPVLNAVCVDYLRSDLKPARTSSEKSCGCSQAAKCPPLATSLK